MWVAPTSTRAAGPPSRGTLTGSSSCSTRRVRLKPSILTPSIRHLYKDEMSLTLPASSLHIFFPRLRYHIIYLIVIINHRLYHQERRGVKLSSKFSRVAQLEINIEDEGARLRADFSTFLASVISGMSKNRDQEEISILNSRWINFSPHQSSFHFHVNRSHLSSPHSYQFVDIDKKCYTLKHGLQLNWIP